MSKDKSEQTKLDKVLILLGLKDEAPEITLEEKTLEDGTVISYDNMEVGTAVMVIVEGEDPTVAPDGEYQISETEKLVVVDGVISEVITEEATEEAPEEVVEEDLSDEAELAEEDVEVVEEEVPETNTEDVFNMDKLKGIIDLEKEGFHTLTFSVANGSIEWGNLYSESFQELKAEKESNDVKVTKLEKEVADMKLEHEAQLKLIGETMKESGLIQAPVETVKVPKTWKELKMESLKKARKENLTN